jgi:hypothetical protein
MVIKKYYINAEKGRAEEMDLIMKGFPSRALSTPGSPPYFRVKFMRDDICMEACPRKSVGINFKQDGEIDPIFSNDDCAAFKYRGKRFTLWHTYQGMTD